MSVQAARRAVLERFKSTDLAAPLMTMALQEKYDDAVDVIHRGLWRSWRSSSAGWVDVDEYSGD